MLECSIKGRGGTIRLVYIRVVKIVSIRYGPGGLLRMGMGSILSVRGQLLRSCPSVVWILGLVCHDLCYSPLLKRGRIPKPFHRVLGIPTRLRAHSHLLIFVSL